MSSSASTASGSADEPQVDILDIDTDKVRAGADRAADQDARAAIRRPIESAITALEQVAKSGKGNLLEAAVDAARARASLGEISDAMERGFGRRHHAVTKRDRRRL
jgi:methylmalonyl-CoA mutase